MIEIEIPSDIKEYEPKFIGPFSVRQAICLIGIAGTMAGGYILINQFMQNGLRVIIPLLLTLPWILIGYYKPYGMKFEDYAKSQLYTSILPPKKRLYKTENLYSKFEKEIELEENPNANTKPQKRRKS